MVSLGFFRRAEAATHFPFPWRGRSWFYCSSHVLATLSSSLVPKNTKWLSTSRRIEPRSLDERLAIRIDPRCSRLQLAVRREKPHGTPESTAALFSFANVLARLALRKPSIGLRNRRVERYGLGHGIYSGGRSAATSKVNSDVPAAQP